MRKPRSSYKMKQNPNTVSAYYFKATEHTNLVLVTAIGFHFIYSCCGISICFLVFKIYDPHNNYKYEEPEEF